MPGMTDRMIRYGILGFGHHGQRRLAPAFAATTHSQLAGMWRRDPAKAQENAQQYGIREVFTTPEALCASPEIDAVFVASPDAFHREHTLLALRHGKHVLCEKPLAMNSREAEQMVRAAHEAGRAFGVAQNFRYNRSLERMRDLVRQGVIGKPIFASAHFSFSAENSPRQWIYDASLACGGPIGDVGIHAVDALRFLLDQDVSEVTTLAQQDAGSGDLEAAAALALRFDGGTLASVQVSFRARYRTLVEVTGSEGLLAAESGLTVDRPIELVHRQEGRIVSTEELSNADAYSRMLDAFALAAQGHGVYAASGDDALRNQLVLDAAFASWRTGQRQQIAPG
jgi:1,5-anhydro-D-fructose reductase (1,5-anhydro-D-mannitol-forming)